MEVSECTLCAIRSGDVADLALRIMDDDWDAEAELVERYSRGVSILIRRETGAAAIAEDLVQEVFRIALEKIRRGDLRDPEKLSGFMSSLARNLVIEHFRRLARQESLPLDEEFNQLPDPAPGQLEELLRKEKRRIVRQIINELNSDRDRQILFRFYIAEEDKERICKELGLTGLHFNRVLFRARERYRELYEKAMGAKR
jgi:RNA polymerase sigma-70 factor (ECF subfamily)